MQPWISGAHTRVYALQHAGRIGSTRALHAAFCTRLGRRPRSIDWISMSTTVHVQSCGTDLCVSTIDLRVNNNSSLCRTVVFVLL